MARQLRTQATEGTTLDQAGHRGRPVALAASREIDNCDVAITRRTTIGQARPPGYRCNWTHRNWKVERRGRRTGCAAPVSEALPGGRSVV